MSESLNDVLDFMPEADLQKARDTISKRIIKEAGLKAGVSQAFWHPDAPLIGKIDDALARIRKLREGLGKP